MFQTVRHWWESGRGKVTLRLFLFEFVVVVAGVFTAQGLANWVQSRADDREGRLLLLKVQDFVRSANSGANYWDAHADCVRKHVDDIARAAASSATLNARDIGWAPLPGVEPLGFNENEWDKLGGVIGDRRVAAIKLLGQLQGFVRQDSEIISDEWTRLRLLDPALGQPTPQDRAIVRLAAIRLDARFTYLLDHARSVKKQIAATGFVPTDEQPSYLKVDSCGLGLWRG